MHSHADEFRQEGVVLHFQHGEPLHHRDIAGLGVEKIQTAQACSFSRARARSSNRTRASVRSVRAATMRSPRRARSRRTRTSPPRRSRASPSRSPLRSAYSPTTISFARRCKEVHANIFAKAKIFAVRFRENAAATRQRLVFSLRRDFKGLQFSPCAFALSP